ncbi:MAG: hypothetical protein MJ153_02675 [Clostridia bacterium]|nr:hypothetical protein [Clostridia bacterium]
MKRIRTLSLVLIFSLLLCLTGCGDLKFKAVSSVKFLKTLSKIDAEYAQCIDECEEGMNFTKGEKSVFYNTFDKQQIADIIGDTTCKEVKMLMSEPYENTKLTYMYLQFDENQDAYDFFVSNWYDSVKDNKRKYDGTLEYDLNDTNGFIYFDCESKDITISEGNILGGIYFAEDTVVAVIGNNSDKASRKLIFGAVEEMEYPFIKQKK